MRVVILQWKGRIDELKAKVKEYGAKPKRLPILTSAVAELLQSRSRMPVRSEGGLYSIAHKTAINLLADYPALTELTEVLV